MVSLIDHHVIKKLISCFTLSYGNEHNQQKAFTFYETAVASLSFQTSDSEYKLMNVAPAEDQAFAEIYLLILHFLKNYQHMLKLMPELSP